MKRLIAGGGSALLVATAIVAGVALPASAHTPEVIATCDSLIASASYYETKPAADAVTEERLVSPAVDYQAPVYGEPPIITPAVEYQPAVYATEYEFRHKLLIWKTTWKEDPNWNAEENDHSLGWYATGNTRQGRLITPEVQAQPPVYGEPPLISPEVQAKDAVYETVVVTPAQDADATPNTVEIIVDGASLGVAEFGTDGEWFVPLAGTGHTYEVRFVAWNDPDGSKGWTKTFTGTTEPCEQPLTPVTPVAPTAEAGIEMCVDGQSIDANGTITLAEVEGLRYVGEDDVEYSGTLTDVAPGEYGFGVVADEGYVIEGDDMVFVTVPASVDVECDVVVEPEPEPTEEPTPTPTTEPTTQPTVTATAAAVTPSETVLAATGAPSMVPLFALGGAAAAAGIALLTVRAIRRRANQQ
jgi:hypothetical protein